ncbi:phosphatase PAP2 family protein [Bacillus sp. DTU_2020_1000418_1_SI_GHA_SEK_038]|uniref:phosphatase PAP2 family protein n=1 Tax=Bacillus sp. DTU_2020_1000418_1_SI_GHA_SEK_038 TaxID=3077585 RepID=UPI0028E7A56D|nr:phosphatase PAP2 family protein [Bacillus sp. DTU_2020_1000418_1_SI_GHA_SEK_038]WNS76777.1 phosphatase PAP2 family protein [Bacillus sp. DTU_2020_1000418_1_SI_GHA_SEK_038]
MEFRKSLVTYVLIVISACIFIYFALAVRSGEPLRFDQNVNSFLLSLFKENSYPFFKALNLIGSSKGIGLIALAVILLLWMKKRDYVGMAVFTLTIATGALLNDYVKDTTARPRPEIEHIVHVKSFSFPSGHAMMGVVLYVLIAYFLVSNIQSRAGKWLVMFLAILMIIMLGVSRIVLQVHYPSDVVSGYALGLAWVLMGLIIYEFLRKNGVNRINRK